MFYAAMFGRSSDSASAMARGAGVERIAALGGAVTATHQPPDGFRLTARLPLARAVGVAA
jgi:hypothetical protein